MKSSGVKWRFPPEAGSCSGFPFQITFSFKIITILNRNHQPYIKQKLSDEKNEKKKQDNCRKVADVFVVIPSLFILL